MGASSQPGGTPEDPLSRREFVERSAVYGSALWALWHLPRPLALAAAQESTAPLVFTEHEWRTVEAITGRIVPTDHEPGAIEANCVNFIDKALAHEDADLRPIYAEGLPGVDAVARERFGADFVELGPGAQDAVLLALEDDEAAGWPTGAGSAPGFFETVRTHTIIGFLADPKYGGNRDYVGWKVAGYPGPRHVAGGYTPAQMLGREPVRPIWEQE